ncbi:MAG: hypothetical protein M3R66_00190 [Actinomycetota bacterium]|nr:hypothetical protein [Actinomycetota bacterium]
MNANTIPDIWSWREFIERATMPDTTSHGSGRGARTSWAGASWDEAVELGTSGWTERVPDVDVAVADLRARDRVAVPATGLAPVAGVTGSEVDVAAYLSGIPECMIDVEPRQMSTQGKVVTFLVPATYSNSADHQSIINRGLALVALCSAIVTAGHSVEVWSGYACSIPPVRSCRYSAIARVITAGEPLDSGRLMFAMAHPAMLRRLWFGVWDSAERRIAERMPPHYGFAPFDCEPADLPDDITDAYVFPYLVAGDPQWSSWDTAIEWCQLMFADLGLLVA